MLQTSFPFQVELSYLGRKDNTCSKGCCEFSREVCRRIFLNSGSAFLPTVVAVAVAFLSAQKRLCLSRTRTGRAYSFTSISFNGQSFRFLIFLMIQHCFSKITCKLWWRNDCKAGSQGTNTWVLTLVVGPLASSFISLQCIHMVGKITPTSRMLLGKWDHHTVWM